MLHVCVNHDGKQVDLQDAQRDVLFNLVDADIQPTMGVCHGVAWKAAESFTLQLPALFRTFFLWNDACMYIWAWNFSSMETEWGRRSPVKEWWSMVNEAVRGIRVMEDDISFCLCLCVYVLCLLLSHSFSAVILYAWCRLVGCNY